MVIRIFGKNTFQSDKYDTTAYEPDAKKFYISHVRGTHMFGKLT